MPDLRQSRSSQRHREANIWWQHSMGNAVITSAGSCRSRGRVNSSSWGSGEGAGTRWQRKDQLRWSSPGREGMESRSRKSCLGRSQGWCSVWKSVWEAALWESLLASDLFGWGRTVEQKVNSGTSSTGTQREADAISFRAALREGGEVEMGQRLQGVREGLLGGGGGQAPWSCPSVYRLFPHPRLYQADSFSFLHWLPQWRGLKSDSWTSWVTIIRDVPSFAMS